MLQTPSELEVSSLSQLVVNRRPWHGRGASGGIRGGKRWRAENFHYS